MHDTVFWYSLTHFYIMQNGINEQKKSQAKKTDRINHICFLFNQSCSRTHIFPLHGGGHVEAYLSYHLPPSGRSTSRPYWLISQAASPLIG